MWGSFAQAGPVPEAAALNQKGEELGVRTVKTWDLQH